MARKVLLDSGPLGEITHPRAERRRPIREWLFRLLEAGTYPRLAEIVDYEHRRKLLHLESVGGVNRLDEFKRVFGYEPLTTGVMLRAASLWADARMKGMPTAPERSLDIDVILAAQALELTEEDEPVVVATTNPRHLSRFVDARIWQEIEPS
ncbi:hypothetical protein BH23ACT11_BH23ACT11_29250 [soil metagenome]